MTKFWAFTEFVDEVDENKVPIEDLIPIGLQKCKQLGIPNVMIELDVNYYGIDYDIFDEDRLCNLLHERIRWIRENLSPKSKIFVNFRDMCTCMTVNPRRVFEVVNFLSSLPKEEQIMGKYVASVFQPCSGSSVHYYFRKCILEQSSYENRMSFRHAYFANERYSPASTLIKEKNIKGK